MLVARHVGFGDGIYVSHDDGKTWKNKGLKKVRTYFKNYNSSLKIQMLFGLPPKDHFGVKEEKEVFINRMDGGNSLGIKTLGDNEWIGATDLVIDINKSQILFMRQPGKGKEQCRCVFGWRTRFRNS